MKRYWLLSLGVVGVGREVHAGQVSRRDCHLDDNACDAVFCEALA